MRAVCVVLCLASAHGDDLDSVLSGFKGKSEVECGEVCKAVGKESMSFDMSGEGDVTTYSCTCDDETVTVACTGNPFIQCCKDKCSGTDCQDHAGGWSCPTDGGCPGGGCTGDWQAWVAAHNVYRCMHDVPAVVWSEPVFQSAKDHFENQKEMEHSKCYDVPPPAGPAGENLFTGTGSYNAMDAVSAWYSEIKDCGAFPGCDAGHGPGEVGHFTAMLWNGAKEIGCLGNKHNLFACRYKAGDFASCNTPNYGGDKSYPLNIFERVKSYSDCVAAVRDCGLTAEEPTGREALAATTGLSMDFSSHGVWAKEYVVPSSPVSLLLVGSMALVVGCFLGAFAVRRFSAKRANRAMEMDPFVAEESQ